ncbi:MAG: TonB family protein [Candidatus Zixiibacteriota bacterium]|nr:MAG: TonB family protein [candidate division Zixibacteria bacterium]
MNKAISSQLLLILVLAFLAVNLNSCVYFNTYYNAKRYFKEGQKENENNETGRPKTTNYQKSIDSAARVLEYYPDSKYVDDALLIMGKAYFEIENYPKAKRKFEELMAKFPDSPLRDEARLYLGKTLLAVQQTEQGIALLTELWSAGSEKNIRLQSQRRLADYQMEKENYRQALVEYQKIQQELEDSQQRADVWYLVGECHRHLEEYEKAEEAYSKVQDEKPTRKREFEARLKRTETMRQRGELEPALQIAEELLRKDIYFTWFEQAYLAKGEILTDLERYDEAIEIFKRILELYPRTDTSAKASYLMGRIYLEKLQDFDKADEYLTRVQTEKSGTEYGKEASVAVADLRVLKSLVGQIDSLTTDLDTLDFQLTWIAEHPGEQPPPPPPDSSLAPDSVLAAMPGGDPLSPENMMDPEMRRLLEMQGGDPDNPGMMPPSATPAGMMDPSGNPMGPSYAGQQYPGPMQGVPPGMTPEAGLRERRVTLAPLPTDSSSIYERMDRDREMLAGVRYRHAEHLWLQFGYADSARIIFQDLAVQEDDPEAAAKSILALYRFAEEASPDSTGPDSLLTWLHERFPETEYDRWVRPRLGLEPLPEPVDSAEYSFCQAEDLWALQEQPDLAVDAYLEVAEQYAETEWGPKALYAAAWLQEYVIEDHRAALAAYDSLLVKFPQSEYVAVARKKTAPLPPEEPEEPDSAEVVPDTTLAEELAAVEPVQPAPTQGSGPPELIGGERALEAFIHSNHLYPLVAMEAGLTGEVTVSFIVDTQGHPRDFQLIAEEPQGFDFGVMAIEALQSMRFRPGYQEGQYVEFPMTQTVRFRL